MMDIDNDEDTLRQLAAGGSMNFSAWPLLLCDIINRIEKIAQNDFPIPVIPPPPRLTTPPEPRFLASLPSSDPIGPSELNRTEQNRVEQAKVAVPTPRATSTAPATAADVASPTSSQDTNKENANPDSKPNQAAADAPTDTASAVSASAGPAAPASSSRAAADSQSQALAPGELPIQIQQQLTEITSTLTRGFPDHPPHTIQRLAELVLHPRQHYCSLPSYLHAVDRVVHVTSGANIFPLSPAIMDPGAMAALANGVPGGVPQNSLSSSSTPTSSTATSSQPGLDEHLGGALLTPIPWLTNRPESVDGADAALSPEPDMNDQDGDSADSLHAQHPPQPQQHSGSGRQRHQQRLSTESTETIEGPNGVGHIETVSVSVNGIISHGVGTSSALAAGLSRGGVGASSRPALSTSQPPQQQEPEGITQGELLREEQRAGVVPVSQVQRRREASQNRSATASAPMDPSRSPAGSTPTEQGEEMDDAFGEADETAGTGAAESEDETPHVRGPEEIGLADTGPQAAGTSIPAAGQTAPNMSVEDIDVEAAMGRPADETRASGPRPQTRPETTEAAGDARDDSSRDRASTPKRDADGEPASESEPLAKRLRESPQESGRDPQDGEKPKDDESEEPGPGSKE